MIFDKQYYGFLILRKKRNEQNPLEDFGIFSIENIPMKYVINKEFSAQLILTLPENFPINPPKILIYPNQIIYGFHYHIFSDYNNYGKFCIDLLENQFMSINEAHTGWKIVILLVYYNSSSKFISDPDLHNNPPKSMINNLMSNMKNYNRNLKLLMVKVRK